MVVLDVPRFEQRVTKNSGSCGPSSVQQVLSYLGKEKSLDEIVKKMRLYDNVGISTDGAIADYMLMQGVNVKVYTIDTKTFDPSWFGLSQKKLLKKLEIERDISRGFKKYNYEGFIDFVKHGGKIEFKPVGLDTIKKSIDNKMPVLAGVDDNLLYKFKRSSKTFYDDDIKGKVWGHELTIAGYKKDSLFVVDPFPLNPFSKDGKYFVDADDLMANIYLQGGYVIVPSK